MLLQLGKRDLRKNGSLSHPHTSLEHNRPTLSFCKQGNKVCLVLMTKPTGHQLHRKAAKSTKAHIAHTPVIVPLHMFEYMRWIQRPK
jgi:hypothetical protein